MKQVSLQSLTSGTENQRKYIHRSPLSYTLVASTPLFSNSYLCTSAVHPRSGRSTSSFSAAPSLKSCYKSVTADVQISKFTVELEQKVCIIDT